MKNKPNKNKKMYKAKESINLSILSNKRFLAISILVLVLFLIIMYKLVDIQILNKDKYTKKLDNLKVSIVYSSSTPRGRIYDRNYNLLVDNVGVNTIYYKRVKGTTTKEQIELAKTLANHIDIDYSKLDKINLKEYYLVNNKEKVYKKITEEEKEKLKRRQITQKDINNLMIERITDEELSIYTDIDKKAAYIKLKLNTSINPNINF